MTETYVTATDFRGHVAQITNCVAWKEADGSPQRAVEVPPPPPPESESVELPDPWEGPYEEVKMFYAMVEPRWNESPEMMDWYSKATGRLQYEANLRSRSSLRNSG